MIRVMRHERLADDDVVHYNDDKTKRATNIVFTKESFMMKI